MYNRNDFPPLSMQRIEYHGKGMLNDDDRGFVLLTSHYMLDYSCS